MLEKLVSQVNDLEPLRAREVILFGLKCARDPRSIGESDLDGLRQHGLGESEIMEAMAMAALAVYANIIADATGVGADDMFNLV